MTFQQQCNLTVHEIQLKSLKAVKKRSPSNNRSSHSQSSEFPNERGIQVKAEWSYAPASEVQHHSASLSSFCWTSLEPDYHFSIAP